jgi:hypothetical protein
VKASKLIFNLFRENDREKIERLLFSATTGAIFILKVAWSGSDTGGLHTTFRMKISRVVTENKGRSIWGFAIRPKRTVSAHLTLFLLIVVLALFLHF